MTSPQLKVDPTLLRSVASEFGRLGPELSGVRIGDTLSALTGQLGGLQCGAACSAVGSALDQSTKAVSDAYSSFSENLESAAKQYETTDEESKKNIDDKSPDDKDKNQDKDGDKNTDQPGTQDQSDPLALAEKLEGKSAEELKNSGEIPMDPSVSNDVCCANFVTAVLQKSGKIDWHDNTVAGAYKKLQSQGWTQVDAAHAKPGAVAVINAHDSTPDNDHIEFVKTNDNGLIKLIGSNNTDGGYGPQVVSTGNPYGNDVVYLNPPD